MKKVITVIMIAALSLASCRWVDDAEDTALQEFKPSELLKKYEWFKDASAQCDKKKADIAVWESKIRSLYTAYDSAPRSMWPKDERERVSIWESELIGIKASYNTLAAEYNSQMAKFNWQFCNVGTLPEGADTPLPREFKPYENQ